jgi:hypothetical protein
MRPRTAGSVLTHVRVGVAAKANKEQGTRRDTVVALGRRYALGHKPRVVRTMLLVGVVACGFLTLLF